MDDASPFPYDGPADLREPIAKALARVVDPEVALNIVDLGLVYGVAAAERRVHVRMTMTSVACPVTGLIVDEVEAELDRSLPPEWKIVVELVWEPPWSTDCLSERARAFMHW